MGFWFAYGPCICCATRFGFNPDRVPSSSELTGKREPICASCVALINVKRAANGLALIVPLPGAYEPIDEAVGSYPPWNGENDD